MDNPKAQSASKTMKGKRGEEARKGGLAGYLRDGVLMWRVLIGFTMEIVYVACHVGWQP